MLYGLLKIWVRAASWIFCRKITVNKPEYLRMKGPLLIAANHPNSFLDAVIIDILFEQHVWSLARGDVFINRNINKLLHSVKILPVYRTSEGVENLTSNYSTFDACLDIFRNNGVVQIFSEGQCVNEWHLRPLKKGTARLAIKAWDDNVPLKVLPLAFNYSSFTSFGKNIFVNIGEPITREMIDNAASEGLRYQLFNGLLEKELKTLVYEIEPEDISKRKRLLHVPISTAKRLVLFIPSLLGCLLHSPLYLPLKSVVKRKHATTGHYDSVLTALLVFTYIPYLVILALIVFLLTKHVFSFALIVLMPFFAWSYVQLKKQ